MYLQQLFRILSLYFDEANKIEAPRDDRNSKSEIRHVLERFVTLYAHKQVSKWDRAKHLELQVSSVGISLSLQMFYGNL